MSDADAEEAVDAADGANVEDAEADDAEDVPEMSEDEQATIPADLAAEAEEAAGAGADDTDDTDSSSTSEETEDDGGDSTGTTAVDRAEGDGDTYGDLYARTLVNVTNAAIEEHGKEGAEETDMEAARQLRIPDHANRLADELGMGEDMPPGQALMASSAIFVMTNVAAKTDLPAQMMDDLGGFDL
jgi:hypothetical protein